MTHFIIHNHFSRRPTKDGQAGRAVERDEEERNRDRMYKDAGITRVRDTKIYGQTSSFRQRDRRKKR